MSRLGDYEAATEAVLGAALRAVHSTYYASTDDWAHARDQAEYDVEQLALAARKLVRAVDALPDTEQPVGW